MRDLLRPILLGAALAAAAPQAAQAAELLPLNACYRSVDSETREMMTVLGRGFTPGEQVDAAIDGVVVDSATVLPNGEVQGQVEAPYQERGERPFTLTLTEVGQPANSASAESRVTALDFRLKPRETSPSRRVRFIGRGFTDGEFVYAHYMRKGRLRKTVRLGAAQGPCGRVDARRRQIPIDDPATGRWTLQVDTQKRYSSQPVGVFVRWAITVQRTLRPGG
ncbi:MAG TPA: hypothetical protein VFN44_02750 [Solirubrobacteraceae bacterium]|nr:hypothetical protein [Solirubrobacteraceae bacterium]